MVFIGEEMADKKLITNRRLYRRFVDIVRFEKLDLEGIKQFLSEVSDIRFSEDAIEKILTESGGKISEVITMVHRTEAMARRNNIRSVAAKDLR